MNSKSETKKDAKLVGQSSDHKPSSLEAILPTFPKVRDHVLTLEQFDLLIREIPRFQRFQVVLQVLEKVSQVGEGSCGMKEGLWNVKKVTSARAQALHAFKEHDELKNMFRKLMIAKIFKYYKKCVHVHWKTTFPNG